MLLPDNDAIDLLSTNEAAAKLKVTPIRVRQLIRESKLTMQKVGRDYAIEKSALESVVIYGKAGRPPKLEDKSTKQI